MKRMTTVVLLVMSLLLFTCAKTTVVPVEDETPSVPAPVEEKAPPQVTTTEGKVAVKCEDTDGNDVATSGRVTVTYNDDSKNDYIGDCPGKSNVQVEYICVGENVASKNTICSQLCVAGLCLE